MTYEVHILAGIAGLGSGFLAMYTRKGGRVHRSSGRVFSVVMTAAALSGLTLAALRNVAPRINIPAGLMTAYLVITAFTTVRPPARGGRPFHAALMLIALVVGGINLVWGIQAVVAGTAGLAFPFVMFGLLGGLGAAGDLTVLRAGPRTGTARLARHLWRMCFALLIAALSFFIGQADVFPEPVRIMPLLALPMLTVLVTMLYWVRRIRGRRRLHGMVLRTGEAV